VSVALVTQHAPSYRIFSNLIRTRI